MGKKHILVTLALLFVVIYLSNYKVVLADEITESNQVVKTQNDEDNKTKQNKELALKSINECKEEIKKEINKIEEKLEQLKEKQEYKNFPAIRLNIDTPIFGLNSICNKKLKITNDVSTADVARGYSIKDIIKTNSLKVPSFSVGSIVVITRDIKFDESITLSDANTCILKLMEYFEQVESINKFLDKQIVKIYSEYIPKEKQNKINDLKLRIIKISDTIITLDNDIVKHNLLMLSFEKYNEYRDKCLEINSKIYEYEKLLENVLIDDKTLIEYEKDIISLESKSIELKAAIDEININIEEKIDLEVVLKNLRTQMINKKQSLKKYIDDSVIEKKIENTEFIENSGEEIINNEEIVASEEIKVYDVKDSKLVDNIDNKIQSLDEKIKEILGETALNRIKEIENENINEEIVNKEEVTDVVIKELNKEEKSKLLNELYKLYKDVLTIENEFYLSNVNMLINDTTYKISNLSKYTDYTSISDIKYVYLELPELLEKDSSLFNLDSMIQIEKYTSNIKNRLNKVIQINKVITKEYNAKVSEDMKNKSRNN